MKLTDMVDAILQQEESQDYQALRFEDRLALIVDWEYGRKQNGRLQRLITQAKFQNHGACIEDIRYGDDRKLDRQLLLELASCNYIPHAKNVIIVGPTGAGKSYPAQALGQAACRKYISTRYVQMPDMLDELRSALTKSDEMFQRVRKRFVNVGLLVIDEWLLFSITEQETQWLLWIIDRRTNHRSTIIASQFEPAEWLDQIPI